MLFVVQTRDKNAVWSRRTVDKKDDTSRKHWWQNDDSVRRKRVKIHW